MNYKDNKNVHQVVLHHLVNIFAAVALNRVRQKKNPEDAIAHSGLIILWKA